MNIANLCYEHSNFYRTSEIHKTTTIWLGSFIGINRLFEPDQLNLYIKFTEHKFKFDQQIRGDQTQSKTPHQRIDFWLDSICDYC